MFCNYNVHSTLIIGVNSSSGKCVFDHLSYGITPSRFGHRINTECFCAI